MSTRELRFQLTEDHIKLLRRAYVSWEDCAFGAPTIDCKRPYGNSSVECDIAEILGWKVDEEDGPNGEQRAAAEAIHRQTQTALQIVLVTGAMQAGEYVKTEEYEGRSWVRVDASPSLPVVREEDAPPLPEIRAEDIALVMRHHAPHLKNRETYDSWGRILALLEAVSARKDGGK